MAEVELTRTELDEGDLPLTCLVCGEAAQTYVKKKFQRMPWWVYLPAALGLFFLPLLVLAIILLVLFPQPSIRIYAPLCYQHKNHWRWRHRTLVVGAALVVGAVALSVLLVYLSLDSALTKDDPRLLVIPIIMMVASGWLGPVILVVCHLVFAYTAVHAKQISTESVTVTPVSEEFIEALRVYRQERELRRTVG